MRERKGAVIGLLIVSTFIGCSSERNLAKAPQAGTLRQSRAGAIDHFVPHISTAGANQGAWVRLFVRERRGAPSWPAVLLVHGRSAAAVPSFDLEYQEYSWMGYLALMPASMSGRSGVHGS